jgi:hypothetical protein
MAETRLRKRSTRQSESDALAAEIEEPPKKKYKRRHSPTMEKPSSRSRRHRGDSSSTPPIKTSSRSSKGGKPLNELDGHKKGKRLLVSLNIQDNALHVSNGHGGRGAAARPRGRGRLANHQRDQSVVSDAGSSNGGIVNGKALAFKNPNFSVSVDTPLFLRPCLEK